jgi:hypothetical protein
LEILKKVIRPIYWKIFEKLNNFQKQEPFFIVGCGHSGTTLLLRILSEHQEVYGVDFESDAFNTGVTRFELFKKWEQKRKEMGKSHWAEKTPRHIIYLDKLFDLFPKAKVIMMQRDGRDVAISMKKRFGDITTGMERWVNENNKGLKFEDDERVLVLKLEDFVADPENNLKIVCKHLGITYSSSLMNYHKKDFSYQNEGVKKTDGAGDNHQLNRNWQVNQPIFKNTNRWRKEASPSELAIFKENKEFQKLLKKLDYSH